MLNASNENPGPLAEANIVSPSLIKIGTQSNSTGVRTKFTTKQEIIIKIQTQKISNKNRKGKQRALKKKKRQERGLKKGKKRRKRKKRNLEQ